MAKQDATELGGQLAAALEDIAPGNSVSGEIRQRVADQEKEAKVEQTEQAQAKPKKVRPGSVNVTMPHVEMVKELAEARGTTMREIAQKAIRNEYVRKFSKAEYQRKYAAQVEELG